MCRKLDDPDKAERSNPLSETSQIKFETQEKIAAFLKDRREHLVIEKRKKKFTLVATFTSIEEARDFITNTEYLIWVCPDS